MSQENVEIVRGHYERLDCWLERYWADPGPVDQTAGMDEVFELLDPEVEWDWVFSPETFRGREQLVRALADWLEAVEAWRIVVEELVDGGGDQVVAVLRVLARGKGSGAPVDQRLFTAFTLRDRKIVRIDDYIERAQALEAAGVHE
jgi:ketosteroid isomerase-like protein